MKWYFYDTELLIINENNIYMIQNDRPDILFELQIGQIRYDIRTTYLQIRYDIRKWFLYDTELHIRFMEMVFI